MLSIFNIFTLLICALYCSMITAQLYAIRLEKSTMIPMRDGIKLSTDLYIPQGVRRKLPTVLIRTEYKKWHTGLESGV
jgi:uncharacterized protein